MRFLIDASLAPSVAEWLRDQGHESVHVMEVGMERATDKEILAKANQENQILLTADLDFPRMLALSGATGPGLILFRGGNYSGEQTLEILKRAFQVLRPAEIENSIVVLQKDRIRRHSLPLAPPERR